MPRRGFTLVEVLVTVMVVFLLVGLLIAGLSLAGQGSRRAAEEQGVSSLDLAVQQFRSDHGFLPPLVRDDVPVVGSNVAVYSFSPSQANATDRDYLRGGGIAVWS